MSVNESLRGKDKVIDVLVDGRGRVKEEKRLMYSRGIIEVYVLKPYMYHKDCCLRAKKSSFRLLSKEQITKHSVPVIIGPMSTFRTSRLTNKISHK